MTESLMTESNPETMKCHSIYFSYLQGPLRARGNLTHVGRLHTSSLFCYSIYFLIFTGALEGKGEFDSRWTLACLSSILYHTTLPFLSLGFPTME